MGTRPSLCRPYGAVSTPLKATSLSSGLGTWVHANSTDMALLIGAPAVILNRRKGASASSLSRRLGITLPQPQIRLWIIRCNEDKMESETRIARLRIGAPTLRGSSVDFRAGRRALVSQRILQMQTDSGFTIRTSEAKASVELTNTSSRRQHS